MKWICKICWRHGDGEGEAIARLRHAHAITQEENQTPDGREHAEKFTTRPHEPDFVFGADAIHAAKGKRESGPALDLEAGDPLAL